MEGVKRVMVMEGLNRARCVDGALRCGVGAVSSIFSMHLACIYTMWCGLMSTAGNTFKDKRLSFAAPFCSACHSPVSLRKYSLTNQKWFFLFFMCNLGAYSGAR